MCSWYGKEENALVLRIHHVTLNFPNCFLSWSETKDGYLHLKDGVLGCWSVPWMIRLARSTVVSTYQRIKLQDMSKTTHLLHICWCPLPAPSCQQTKTALLLFFFPNLAECLSWKNITRIWGMQGELRRIRTFLKFNKLYVIGPPPWIVSSIFIFDSYLNFQAHQRQHYSLPNAVLGRCAYYKLKNERPKLLISLCTFLWCMSSTSPTIIPFWYHLT